MEAGDFLLFRSVETDSWAQPASYLMGVEVSSPGVKRPGREADRLHLSSADAKSGGDVPPLTHTSGS
jgi:hypothetical protein